MQENFRSCGRIGLGLTNFRVNSVGQSEKVIRLRTHPKWYGTPGGCYKSIEFGRFAICSHTTVQNKRKMIKFLYKLHMSDKWVLRRCETEAVLTFDLITLTFDFSTSKYMGSRDTGVMGFAPANFQLAIRPSSLDLGIGMGQRQTADRQTDGRMDGRTDSQTPGHSKDRAYALCREVIHMCWWRHVENCTSKKNSKMS